MSNMSGSVLTAAGRNLQAKVQAGATLTFTKMKLGDGTESAAVVDGLLNLVSPRIELGISDITTKDNMVTVTGVILNTNISAGFQCREAGLFARDPDLGEILYAIALDTTPDLVPPSTASVVESAEFAMVIAIDNASSITVNVDPAGLISKSMLSDAARLVERGTAYTVGQQLYDGGLSPNLILVCTTAGTTAATIHDFSTARYGDVITDGSVVWLVSQPSVTGADLFADSSGEVTIGNNDILRPGVKFELNGNDVSVGSDEFYSGRFAYNADGDITLV